MSPVSGGSLSVAAHQILTGVIWKMYVVHPFFKNRNVIEKTSIIFVKLFVPFFILTTVLDYNINIQSTVNIYDTDLTKVAFWIMWAIST